MKIICPFIYSTSYYLPITVQFCQCLFICLTTWHNLEVVLLIKHAFSCCSKNSVIMCFWMKAKHRQNLKVRFRHQVLFNFSFAKLFSSFMLNAVISVSWIPSFPRSFLWVSTSHFSSFFFLACTSAIKRTERTPKNKETLVIQMQLWML